MPKSEPTTERCGGLGWAVHGLRGPRCPDCTPPDQVRPEGEVRLTPISTSDVEVLRSAATLLAEAARICPDIHAGMLPEALRAIADRTAAGITAEEASRAYRELRQVGSYPENEPLLAKLRAAFTDSTTEGEDTDARS